MRLKEFLGMQEALGGLGHPSSGGMGLNKARGTIHPGFYATWKKKMQEKGAVKFQKVELDNIMAYDKDGKGVGAYDAWSNMGVEMNEAATPDDDDYDGKDGEYVNAFFVAGWNEEAGKSWIGKISKSDGKWVETSAEGAEPNSWGGKRYMSYLSPDEVMSWLGKDYDEVEGPFFDKDEAVQYAENRFGPLSEEWNDSGAKDANGKWSQYRDGKIGVAAMATWLYGSRVHKKSKADKLKSAYGAIAQQENTSKLISKAKGDSLRSALKSKYGTPGE